MKSKNIYIIRHGQTDYNLRRMVQGRGIDSSLNDTGRRQARQFYEAYKSVPFDKVYTSMLRRTKESVQGFLDLGVPTEALSGFDEISWGEHEGLTYDSDRHKEYLMGLDEWSAGNLDHAVADGESPNEVAIRQREAIEYIMTKKDEQTILICSHGRAMRILISWMAGQTLIEAETYEHSNLCLYQMKYSSPPARLIRVNDIKHLE